MGFPSFHRPDDEPENTRSDIDDTRVDFSTESFHPKKTRVDDSSFTWGLKTRVDDDSSDVDPIPEHSEIHECSSSTRRRLSDAELDKLWDEVDLEKLSLGGEDIACPHDTDEYSETEPLHENVSGLEHASHPLPMKLAMQLPKLQNNASERQIHFFLVSLRSNGFPMEKSDISLSELFLSKAISDVDVSSSRLEAGEYLAGEKFSSQGSSLEMAGEKMYRYIITKEEAIVILSFDTRQMTCSIEFTITETIREDTA